MSGRPRTPPRSRLGITRDSIVAKAAEIVTEYGLGALTMRRVGDALGIGTMTLYGYFRDKDELLDAVVDLLSSQTEIPRSTGPWKQRMRALMLALHAQLVEHPFLVELRGRGPLSSAGAMRWTEVGLEILIEAGFEPPEAARAFRPLFIYAFGHARFFPAADADQVMREARATLSLLPPDRFPCVLAAADEIAASIGDPDSYRHGLERQLDGIETQLEG